MVKAVKLSPDGMVCLSAGTDCTFKVWDIASRRCILTHGGETPLRKLSSFHKDTITAMDVSFEDDIAYTCSKDGHLFKSSLIEQHKFSRIHQLDPKLMINTLAVDYKH
jgi:WD40 repeat protein